MALHTYQKSALDIEVMALHHKNYQWRNYSPRVIVLRILKLDECSLDRFRAIEHVKRLHTKLLAEK